MMMWGLPRFTRQSAIRKELSGKTSLPSTAANCLPIVRKNRAAQKQSYFKKADKIKNAIKYLVKKHHECDKQSEPAGQRKREKESIKKLQLKADKINNWLTEHDEKIGTAGKPIKSNIIDNESAKMSSSHGVIQGYNGITSVDDKHQAIVWAGAFTDTHVADNQFRKRGIRFQDYRKHKKKVENWKPVKKKQYFSVKDFNFDEKSGKVVCPAGQEMWLIRRKTGLTAPWGEVSILKVWKQWNRYLDILPQRKG